MDGYTTLHSLCVSALNQEVQTLTNNVNTGYGHTGIMMTSMMASMRVWN